MRDDHPSTSAPLVRRLLASVAQSPRALAVAAEAYRLAGVLGAEIVFLHVGPETAEARRFLEETARGFSEGSESPRIVVRAGRPDRVICAVAEEAGADLIVAGALEKEGPLEYYAGSIARRIARRAPCSVLLLTEPRTPPAPARRIVVRVQSDDRAREVVRFALALAAQGEEATVFAVREYDIAGLAAATDESFDSGARRAYQDRAQAEEQARLADFLADMGPMPVRPTPVALRGREGWEAAEFARREGADLLVMAAPRRRLGFLDKLFQHGVEFALERLPCALLLYRHG